MTEVIWPAIWTSTWVGLVGGLITGVSPCVLPMLPVLFLASGNAGTTSGGGSSGSSGSVSGSRGSASGVGSAGGVTGSAGGAPSSVASWSGLGLGGDRLIRTAPRGRPFAVVGGLVVSFSVLVLVGSVLVAALGLPPGVLRWVGIVLLAVAGLGVLWPALGGLLQRPFNRIPGVTRTGRLGPFALGLVLGTLYLPCAGPVLAAIAVAGATGTVDGRILALTGAFAVGTAIPLLAFSLAGARAGRRWSAGGRAARRVRNAGGVAMILLATSTALGVTNSLLTAVPDYTASLQASLGTALAAPPPAAAVAGVGSLAHCVAGSPALADCGPAPAITGADRWFNTPGEAALTQTQLKGRVVIVDFWALGCINCTRALPHVQDLYAKYADAGLEVIGVHSPEFDYEHDADLLQSTITERGFTFPVAQDNSFGIWSSYGNHYWPALYLIDRDGFVRYVTWGEGNYELTETHVQELLAQQVSA